MKLYEKIKNKLNIKTILIVICICMLLCCSITYYMKYNTSRKTQCTEEKLNEAIQYGAKYSSDQISNFFIQAAETCDDITINSTKGLILYSTKECFDKMR